MKLGGLNGLLKYESYRKCMDLGMFGLMKMLAMKAYFLKSFRQRLIDCSIQDWLSKLNDPSKTRHYKYRTCPVHCP